MLERLRREGFEAVGYDVLPSLSECGSIAELLEGGVDIVLLSLPDGPSVEQAVTEIASAADPGALVVDTSTDNPDTARRCHDALAHKGVSFLDAPVSGGKAGAAEGALTFLIGGSEEALSKATQVLDALGSTAIHVGPSGCGQAAKLVNNFLVASHLASAREAIALGRAAGVDPERLLDAVNRSSGRSAVTEVNYPRWILTDAFDSGFSTKLMRKDLREALGLGERLGVRLSLGTAVGERWNSADAPEDDEDFNRLARLDPDR